MKKKVLIIIADIGNGHKSAASALTSVFNSKYKDEYEVKTIDLFKEADVEPFNSADISYKFLSQNKAYEQVSNWTWKFTNSSIGYDIYKSYFLGRIFAASEKVITSENPDLVISAYPLTCTIVRALKEKGHKFKYVVTITDLITMHRSWADPTADLISCPTTDAVKKLIDFGAKPEKIIYPLFPLKPELKSFRPRDEVLQELGLDIVKPTILMTGGGLGTKAIANGIEKLANRTDIQTIIIAGRLESFKNELERKYKGNPSIKVLGFVDNMYDFFNATDIVIGKPGATTVMEVELFDRKAIFTSYIGEHDAGNVDYALRDPKIRYIGDDWDKLEENIDDLLTINLNEIQNNLARSFDESEKIIDEIAKIMN